MPSDLRRYFAYNYATKEKHGSVMNYVLCHKLSWSEPITASAPLLPTPFANPADYSVKWNDWPYGIDARIVHLVVWTKFELAEDPATTDITPAARRMVDDFVDGLFVRRCGRENVIWFKNWRSLKSVRAVEHFHVMLFAPDPDFVSEVTGGDEAAGLREGIDGAWRYEAE